MRTGHQEKRASAEAYLRVVEVKLEQARYLAEAQEKEQAGDFDGAKAALDKAALLGKTPEIEGQMARLAQDADGAHKKNEEKLVLQQCQDLRAQLQREHDARRRALRVSKWVLAGVGLATVAAGAVLLGLDGHQSCPVASTGCAPRSGG